MPRPNRRPDVSFKHFRCIGYKAENICTKAELDEYPPIEQDPIDGFSEFDVSKWPKRSVEFGLGDRCPKGEIPEKFCLNVEDDIVDLCFVVKETTVKQRTVHLYLCRELERRAWEKYGGPTGLEAARKRLQECFLSYPSPVESCKDGGEQNGESGEEDKAKENDGDSEEEKEDGGVDGAETPEETVQSQMDLSLEPGQPTMSSTPQESGVKRIRRQRHDEPPSFPSIVRNETLSYRGPKQVRKSYSARATLQEKTYGGPLQREWQS